MIYILKVVWGCRRESFLQGVGLSVVIIYYMVIFIYLDSIIYFKDGKYKFILYYYYMFFDDVKKFWFSFIQSFFFLCQDFIFQRSYQGLTRELLFSKEYKY